MYSLLVCLKMKLKCRRIDRKRGTSRVRLKRTRARSDFKRIARIIRLTSMIPFWNVTLVK